MKSILKNKVFHKRSLSILLIICLFLTLITIPATNAFASEESIKLGDSENPPEITIDYVGTTPKYPIIGDEIEVKYRITADKFNYTMPDIPKEIVLVIDASGSMEYCSNYSGSNTSHKHDNVSCSIGKMDLSTGKCAIHEGKEFPHKEKNILCNASRLDMTKYAAINFVNKLSEISDVKISLVTYSRIATATEFIDISKNEVNGVDVNKNKRDGLIKKIKNISMSSGTNLGEGIRQAAKILGNDTYSTSKNRSIIVMTDGKPSKYSIDGKNNYYLDIEGNSQKYSKDFNETKSYEYAQEIAKLIPDRQYNNIFSIGYALGEEGQGGNLMLSDVHKKMGGSEDEFYAGQGSAIDDIFNEIADSLILDYKFNSIIDIELNDGFEALENMSFDNGKHIITLPEVRYELKEGTTNEYLPNGKDQEIIEFSFKVKANSVGETNLFSDANLKYTDVKGVEHVVPLGGPTIKVYEKLPIPIIEGELISDKIVNSLPNEENEVKYMVNPKPFEYIPNDNTEDKEVAFIVDTSNDMNPMSNLKNGLRNEIINHFLNNPDTSKMKFNFITYNRQIDNLVVDSETRDNNGVKINYRNELQQKMDSISKSNSSDKKLGEAIKKADEFFKNSNNKESIKNIVIIAAGDPTDEFPDIDIDIDKYNVITLAVSNKATYENPYSKLKEWHNILGGDDLNYFVSSSSENNNDIDATTSVSGNNPLAPEGKIMHEIAEKLIGANYRAYTIRDVKLNFDLALNFDAISGLVENGPNYLINIPKIRYVATREIDNTNGEYLFEADPVEVSFKIKPKADKYGTLEFGQNTSVELRNYISYTKLDGSKAKNPVETPIVIVKDKRVTIQIRDSYGELDDKYDTNDNNTEAIEYLKNNIKNEFDKDYRLYGDSYADITFTGVNTNYLKYKISTVNEYPNDNGWDAEIVQQGGNPDGIISGDIGEQGTLTHQAYNVLHLESIEEIEKKYGQGSLNVNDKNTFKQEAMDYANSIWGNTQELFRYPFYDGIKELTAITTTGTMDSNKQQFTKCEIYTDDKGNRQERWVPQSIFTHDVKISNSYKEASRVWGYLKVDVSGAYKFKTYSDDGMKAILTVDGEEVQLVNKLDLHSKYESSVVSVDLQKDIYYPIFIEYFNYGDIAVYNFQYSKPGSNDKFIDIPADNFWSSKSKAPGESVDNVFRGETGIKLPEEAGKYYIAYESGNKSSDKYEVKNKGIYGPFEVTNRFKLERTTEEKNDGSVELSYNITPNTIDITDIYRTKQELNKVIKEQSYITNLDVINLSLSDIIPNEFNILDTTSTSEITFNLPSGVVNGQLAGSLNGNVIYSLNTQGENEDWSYTASPFSIKLKLSTNENFENDIELSDKIAKLVYQDIVIKNGDRHNKEQFFNGVKVEAPQTSIITAQGLYDNIDTITPMTTIDVVDNDKNKPLYTIGTKLKINSRNSTFNINLPKDATLDGEAYIYEVENDKVNKSTKKQAYTITEGGKIKISNKSNTLKVALDKDKEYIVVYKIKLSNVNEDGKSTFIKSTIDRDTEKILYFNKAKLPDLF